MDLLYVGRMVDILELFTMTSNRVSELITLALNIDIYLIVPILCTQRNL